MSLPATRPDPSNAPQGAASPRVRAVRPASGLAWAVSLALHALAVGGLGWATWTAAGAGPARRAIEVALVEATEPAAEEASAPEPEFELEALEPTEPVLVDVPFVLPRADESRFDPEFTEVREPTRAIAHWMSLSLADISRSARAGDGALDENVGEAPPVAVARPLAPPPDPLAQAPEAEPESESALAHAVLVHRPDPEYPRASLRLREEGAALLRIHVDETGAVRDVEIVRSSGAVRLDRAAVDGVKSWRFEPARRAGAPIATSVLHQITFKLG